MDKQKSQSEYGVGGNFAPLKPFLDLKDSTIPEKTITDHELTKEIRNKYQDLVSKDKSAWRSRICAGQINALFIEGEQILRINTFNGNPRIETPNKNDPTHIKSINKMRRYCTEWLAKWKTSKPDILLTPLSNTDQAINQVRKANTVVDYLEKSFFSTWFDQQEGLNAQIWGWYGRMVTPDFSSNNYSVFKDILGEKEFQIGKATGICDCGYRGDKVNKKSIGGKEFNACPECGDMSYDYEPPITRIMKVPVRKEKVFLPDIICRPLVLAGVRFDLGVRAEVSEWFIDERRVEPHSVRSILGNIRFPEGESGNDFGLDTIDYLASRGASMGGKSDVAESKKKDRVTLTEMYLSADELYDLKIGGDEKTVEGKTLPKGQRMSKVFPDGCKIVGINGMSLILGIYAGCHKESLSSGVYHMKPQSGAGQGIDDVIPIQQQFNRRYSQIDKNFATRGTPAILMPENGIEPRFIKELNNPGAVIPVKIQNFPDIRDISQLAAPLQGQPIDGALADVTFNRLEDMLQTAYHIMNFSGGNPRADNKTATGAEILDANADEIFTPVLSIKAECAVETLHKGFDKWCEFTPEARFIPYKSRSKSGFGIEIKGSDVEGEYNWSYVPGSEAPKNRFTQNQARANFFGMFGGANNYLMAKQQFPKEVVKLEQDFDINFATEEAHDTVGDSSRLRFDRALQMLTNPPDYLGIIAQIEPSMEITEKDLMDKSAWFQDLLDSEEGLQMDRVGRGLIAAFVIAFKELSKGQTISVQQDAAEIQVASQQPIIDAQNQQAQAQAQQQSQMQSEQQSQQMIGGAVQSALAGEQQESAQDHEKETQENDHAMDAVRMMHEAGQNEDQRGHEAAQTTNQQANDLALAKQNKTK